MSRQLFAAVFVLLTIRLQSLIDRARGAIFIHLSKPLSTLLIASFLGLFCFVLLFHKLQSNYFARLGKPSREHQGEAIGTAFPA